MAENGEWLKVGSDVTTNNQLEIARNFVSQSFSDKPFVVCALVGSIARGWGDENSDIDVLILKKNSNYSEKTLVFQGKTFDVITYDIEEFQRQLYEPPFDFPKLRVASTIATAILLAGDEAILDEMKLLNKYLRLDPAITEYYLQLATNHLLALTNERNFLVKRILAGKVVNACILLLLSHTEFRVLKLKWSWPVLEAEFPEIADAAFNVLGLTSANSTNVEKCIRNGLAELAHFGNEENKPLEKLYCAADTYRLCGNNRASSFLLNCLMDRICTICLSAELPISANLSALFNCVCNNSQLTLGPPDELRSLVLNTRCIVKDTY